MTDPDDTPDLEEGGGVAPGSTPPAEAQTSGLSASEPDASRRFTPVGALTIAAVVAIVVVFGASAVAIVVFAFMR